MRLMRDTIGLVDLVIYVYTTLYNGSIIPDRQHGQPREHHESNNPTELGRAQRHQCLRTNQRHHQRQAEHNTPAADAHQHPTPKA